MPRTRRGSYGEDDEYDDDEEEEETRPRRSTRTRKAPQKAMFETTSFSDEEDQDNFSEEDDEDNRRRTRRNGGRNKSRATASRSKRTKKSINYAEHSDEEEEEDFEDESPPSNGRKRSRESDQSDEESTIAATRPKRQRKQTQRDPFFIYNDDSQPTPDKKGVKPPPSENNTPKRPMPPSTSASPAQQAVISSPIIPHAAPSMNNAMNAMSALIPHPMQVANGVNGLPNVMPNGIVRTAPLSFSINSSSMLPPPPVVEMSSPRTPQRTNGIPVCFLQNDIRSFTPSSQPPQPPVPQISAQASPSATMTSSISEVHKQSEMILQTTNGNNEVIMQQPTPQKSSQNEEQHTEEEKSQKKRESDDDYQAVDSDDEEDEDTESDRRRSKRPIRRRSTRNRMSRPARRRLNPREKKRKEDEEYVDEDNDSGDDDEGGEDIRKEVDDLQKENNTDDEDPITYRNKLRPRDKMDKPNYIVPPSPAPSAPSLNPTPQQTPQQKRIQNRYKDIKSKYDALMKSRPVTAEESSSDSSDDEKRSANRAIANSGASSSKGEYDHLNPINMTAVSGTSSNKKKPSADIDPLPIDKRADWDAIGGLHHHVKALKEMVILPLLYPEVFDKFAITPPRGVIFHGPPGTGKTLVARALANSCTTGGRTIAFFMRKGADILSKWVGEAEKQLRLLFEQATKLQPSIIFFDEIDGLAPVRSSKQDYIHSSIVSTLLALMDGLDNRGQVIVIGATNRVDAIDPALRRPGRFDRELFFPLPSRQARKEIFSIHTRAWNPAVPKEIKEDICRKTVGYCGADIKALCAEAALRSFRRRYPQVYESKERLAIKTEEVQVTKADFMLAMNDITPASHRSAIVHSKALPAHLAPSLSSKLEEIKNIVREIFPVAQRYFDENKETSDDEDDTNSASVTAANRNSTEKPEVLFSDFFLHPPAYKPWLLIHGEKAMGQLYLAKALLHAMEEVSLFSVGAQDLVANTVFRSPEEVLIGTFAEARKNVPSIIWIPNIDTWWTHASEGLQSTLCTLLEDLPSTSQIFVVATCQELQSLPAEVGELFSEYRYHVTPPTYEQRKAMFKVVLDDIKRVPPPPKPKEVLEPLPVVPSQPKPGEAAISEKEEKKLKMEEEKILRELRINLREVLFKLIQYKRFSHFMKAPTSRVPAPGQLFIYDIMMKCEKCVYVTVGEFIDDFKSMAANAELYTEDSKKSETTVSRNFMLAQQLIEMVETYSEPISQDLRAKCKAIARRRKAAEKAKAPATATAAASSSDPIPVDDQSPAPAPSSTPPADAQPTPSSEITNPATSSSAERDVVMADTPTPAPTTTNNAAPTPPLPSPVPSITTESPASSSAPSNPATSTTAPLPSEPNTQQQPPAAEPQQQPVVVEIDEERLQTWFEHLLRVTEGFNVDQLDRCFSLIYRHIYNARFTAQRNELLKKLEEVIASFAAV